MEIMAVDQNDRAKEGRSALGMSFDEALRRFIQADPKEVRENMAAEKQRKRKSRQGGVR